MIIHLVNNHSRLCDRLCNGSWQCHTLKSFLLNWFCCIFDLLKFEFQISNSCFAFDVNLISNWFLSNSPRCVAITPNLPLMIQQGSRNSQQQQTHSKPTWIHLLICIPPKNFLKMLSKLNFLAALLLATPISGLNFTTALKGMKMWDLANVLIFCFWKNILN